MRVINREAIFLSQVNRQQIEQSKYQQQVSTGIAVARPGDDASVAGTIQQFVSALQRMERHENRISVTRGVLETQEAGLLQTQNILVRAEEIATQAANEVFDEQQRAQLSTEVWGLRDALVGIANTKYQDSYVWGGLDDRTEPFTVATAPPPNGYMEPGIADPNNPASIRYEYADFAITGVETGKNSTRNVAISDTEHVRVNTPGDQVFEGAIASLERLGRALDGFQTDLDVATGLPDGMGVAYNFPTEFSLQTNDIRAALDEIKLRSSDDIIPEISNVGARSLRLNQAEDTLNAVRLATETARAGLQDADIVEAVTKVTALNTSLEALFNAFSSTSNLSLMNFL